MIVQQNNTAIDPELPRVTVMIPTYNQADIILRAVDSALAQDYPNLEVIVADDASPDNTEDVIATRRDDRLRYHRNPTNLGRVGNYRNTLYNLATGKWVVNLDGDDYYTDNGFISTAIRHALRDASILMVMANIRTDGGLIRTTAYSNADSKSMTGCQALYEFIFNGFPLFHMATLYKRSKALSCNFYNIDTLSADTESLWRLAVQGKVIYINSVAGIWQVSGNSSSRNETWEKRIADLKIWDNIFCEAGNHGMPPQLTLPTQKRAIAIWAYAHLSMIALSGNWRQLTSYLCAYIKCYGLGNTLFIASRWRLYLRIIYGSINRTMPKKSLNALYKK